VGLRPLRRDGKTLLFAQASERRPFEARLHLGILREFQIWTGIVETFIRVGYKNNSAWDRYDQILRNTIIDTDYVTRRFIASLAWAACWVQPGPQRSFVFGVDVRQECGRGEVNADDAAVGSAGTPA